MDNIFSINIFEDVELRPIEDNEFYELANTIDEYDMLIEDIRNIGEAVQDDARSVDRSFRTAVNNTIDTTKGVLSAYDGVTDAGGGLIKAGWDLAMKLLKIAIKAISFVSSILVKIPTTLSLLIDKLSNSAALFRNKLRGNISLYITYDDVKYINEHYIFKTINEIISCGVEFGKDQLWAKLGKRKVLEGSKAIKMAKQIMKGRLKIEGMKFTPSPIDLSNEANKTLYFGNGRDNNASSVYLLAIKDIISSVEQKRTDLQLLSKDFKAKYESSIQSGQFANFGIREQKFIQRAITDLAKTSVDVSKIVSYANKDINTIIRSVNKLAKVNNTK